METSNAEGSGGGGDFERMCRGEVGARVGADDLDGVAVVIS